MKTSPTSPAAPSGWSSSKVLSAIPSWLGSCLLHAGLFVACLTLLKDCQGEPGTSLEDYGDRVVGVYVKSENTRQITQQKSDSTESTDPATEESRLVSPLEFQGDDTSELEQPPVSLSLPDPVTLIGMNGRPLPASTGSSDPRLPDEPTISEPVASGTGQGQTSMFGIRDSGQRFVYVIDSSGSMYGDPMRVARAELIASLRGLNRTQEFGIIFYNKKPHLMRLREPSGQGLYRASDYNQQAALDFIGREQPQAGTDHMLALRMALAMKPDVIFFLTDAKQPVLKTADLHEIDSLNSSGTRIHCIEFGLGADLELDSNFLRRLARRNSGGYSYRDINQFRRRQ